MGIEQIQIKGRGISPALAKRAATLPTISVKSNDKTPHYPGSFFSKLPPVSGTKRDFNSAQDNEATQTMH